MKYLLVVLMLVSGCATYAPPVKKEIESTRTYQKSFDDTWASLISFISSNGMNIKTMDKASGLISFEKANDSGASQAFFDCGTVGSVVNIPVYSSVTSNILVKSEDKKKTTVTVNMFQSVKLQTSGYVTAEKECFSNGAFEKKVLDSIK